MANSSSDQDGQSKLTNSALNLENSTFEKSNRTGGLSRIEHEDIGHIPNNSRDDEYYHDKSD